MKKQAVILVAATALLTAFADGVFYGTHAELEDGREHKSGTLTLRR